jgi:hypothetical protein
MADQQAITVRSANLRRVLAEPEFSTPQSRNWLLMIESQLRGIISKDARGRSAPSFSNADDRGPRISELGDVQQGNRDAVITRPRAASPNPLPLSRGSNGAAANFAETLTVTSALTTLSDARPEAITEQKAEYGADHEGRPIPCIAEKLS